MIDNIELFTHTSIKITDEGKAIYVDPYQIQEEPHDADYILVTHDHYDHFSPEDIVKVAKHDTILVIPETMENKVHEVAGVMGKTVTVAPGIYKVIDGLELEDYMIKHVIIWTLKEDVEDKKKVKAGIKEGLEGLKGVVPGLVDIVVRTEGLGSSNTDLMLDSTFESEDALKGYSTHPAHVKVADEKVRPYTMIRSCFDYEE